MEKLPTFFLYAIAYMTVAASCMHNDHDTSISYKDTGRYYSMKAYFSRNKTRKVEHYMDETFGTNSRMSFINSKNDGTISLDNHAKFYMKKYPGVLEIKMDKDENSYENFDEIKSMCQGIKKVLTE